MCINSLVRVYPPKNGSIANWHCIVIYADWPGLSEKMSYNIDCGVAMLIVYFLHMQLFNQQTALVSGDLQDRSMDVKWSNEHGLTDK